jgi:hypothetical protein
MTLRMPPSRPVRRKVFVSYHHRGDQEWFDYFSLLFGQVYEIFYDQSLDGRIRSDDPEYVNRRIREDYIVGSSVTIVLCGAQSGKRKYVDWEIYSTLHHQHALLGIALPTAVTDNGGRIIVPTRLHDNIQTQYAHWIQWTEDPGALQAAIEIALERSRDTRLINNSRPRMARNLP